MREPTELCAERGSARPYGSAARNAARNAARGARDNSQRCDSRRAAH
jgi:hypothetical protein